MLFIKAQHRNNFKIRTLDKKYTNNIEIAYNI